MNPALPVIWQGQHVGYIDDPKIDHFHLYGRWVADISEEASRFVASVCEGEHEVLVVIGTGSPELRGSAESLDVVPGLPGTQIEVILRP